MAKITMTLNKVHPNGLVSYRLGNYRNAPTIYIQKLFEGKPAPTIEMEFEASFTDGRKKPVTVEELVVSGKEHISKGEIPTLEEATALGLEADAMTPQQQLEAEQEMAEEKPQPKAKKAKAKKPLADAVVESVEKGTKKAFETHGLVK